MTDQPTKRDWDPAASESSLKRKTARGGAVALVAEGLDFIIRLGSIAILARLITPEHFGLVAMVAAITSVAERFKDLGLSMATVQSPQLSEEEACSLFWINVAFAALIAVVLAALAVPISTFFSESRLIPIALALASVFLIGGLAVQHQALMRRRMMFFELALTQISSSLISTGIAIALALEGWGYWALVVREICRALLVTFGSWYFIRWVPRSPKHGAGVLRHLKFGSNIAFFNLIGFFVYNLDQMVIGRLFGAASLGLYRQGVNVILSPIYQIIYPINSVAESALSRLAHQVTEYRYYYTRILGTFALVTMPMAALVFVYAEEIILFLMGSQWILAAEFVRIFAVVAFVRPCASTVGFVMTTQGKSARYLAWGMINAVGLATGVLVGAQWGPEGVALGHVAAAYLVSLPTLAFGFSGSPVRMRDFASAIWRPFVSSLFLVGILFALKTALHGQKPLVHLLAGIPVAGASYLALVFLLPGGRLELEALFRLALSVLKRDGGSS